MHEQVGYFTHFVSLTKSAIFNQYDKLPLKAPKFVENTVSKLNPYLDKVTGAVDNQIEKTLTRIQPITNTVQTQIHRGSELKEMLKSGLKQKSQEGVNLATQNRATQLVFNTCDKLTDKVFCSIEQRVLQLQNLMKVRPKTLADEDKIAEPKKGSFKNYHKRTLKLAQEITSLSNDLFSFFKKEVVLKNKGAKVGFWVTQAKTIISSHCRASLTLIQVVSIRPMSSIYTTCKVKLTQMITFYKENGLMDTLQKQLEELKQNLTKEQLMNYMQLLKESLKMINMSTVTTFTQTQYIFLKKLYLEALDNKVQKEMEMEPLHKESTHHLEEQHIQDDHHSHQDSDERKSLESKDGLDE